MTIPNFPSLQSFLRMENSRLQMLCLRNFHMPLSIFFSFSFAFISRATDSYASEVDPQYANCSLPFTCGQMLPLPTSTRSITYPFMGNRSSYCGVDGFGLECQEDDYISMDFNEQRYRVLNIDHTNRLMTVARNDLWNGPCTPSPFLNTTMNNNTLFHYTSDVKNVSIFYCLDPHPGQPYKMKLPDGITCQIQDHPNRRAIFIEEDDVNRSISEYPGLNQCDRIKVPVPQRVISEVASGLAWKEVLRRGFQLTYTVNGACSGCQSSGGACGSNSSSPQNFACYCSDQPYPHTCLHSGGIGTKSPLYIGIGVATGGMILFMAIILYCFYKNKLRQVLYKGLETDKEIETFIKHHGSITPKRFSYSQVKSMTDSFVRKLGQGGFGTVYKGKLRDDTLVAVKLLNSSKGNGEEFINEVASISRTSHINIVTLLGFCYEGNKRALIYEFMSNGSLDKFLGNNKNVSTEGINLTWDKLYQIAVGIARGLEYLHKGCNTRILHFDIKPQNILLDDNFCPKISDFGLSKLCLKRESIVSMMAARGTIGYIAPEVFIRNFGDISYKSDVYSYGMMLLEMVRGKNKNSTYEASQSSEVYFQDQVYKLIEDGYGEGIYSQLKDEDKQTVRKMALVGVWCIQTDPKQRPSMGRVIEMLEGSIEAFPIPEKPFLFSPTTSPHHSLSILSST